MEIDIGEFRIEPNSKVELSEISTVSPFSAMGKMDLRVELALRVREFSDWQERLYAEGKRALLVIFQGMDASGKDSTIKRVASGVNPQGLRVFNYDRPTSQELQRSYLHRHWIHFPAQGFVVFYNRSHYEEVLVVRVHPEILRDRNIDPDGIGDDFWDERLEDIVALEQHLARNATAIVKIFLHISNKRQRQRLRGRINKPEKHWKFDPSDLRERVFWDDYQFAYSQAIGATSKSEAPWYVVPADHKPSARLIVSEIIVDAMRRLDPKTPQVDPDKQRIIDYYRGDGEIK